jgi:hypothetical protein
MAGKKFKKFLIDTELITSLNKITSEELRKNNLVANMFDEYKEYTKKKTMKEYLNLIIGNYLELLSDIFGCALFGHTYIVAMYLFSSTTAELDTPHWEKGYLSWRFRLQNCIRFLSFVLKKNNVKLDTCDLYENICSTIKGDIKDPQSHDVCKLLIESFWMKEEEIFETICEYSKPELFVDKIDAQQIKAACDRLEHGVIPNAMIKDDEEHPIDIRNILFAIWLVSYKENKEDIQSFSEHIQHHNLLGIKGIELSVEQEKYNDFVKKQTG